MYAFRASKIVTPFSKSKTLLAPTQYISFLMYNANTPVINLLLINSKSSWSWAITIWS